MRFFPPLTFEVLVLNSEDAKIAEINNINPKIGDMSTRVISLYEISAVMEAENEGLCMVYSGSEVWLVPMSREDFDNDVMEQLGGDK